ncbi:hypothetical protein DRV85_14275 [Rhodosalinus halophilus]|uniref:Uncharacterized protein n=1 Tax=Rhodosalinus halophilus TaxID=2259333 RepID=A0A365U653_9RHOB|nr:hypothetical protein [Rhodosalinus halophilus]RBI83816.1 hypothetical protein DRV85_14275 [Rhodosalinus halophilus]
MSKVLLSVIFLVVGLIIGGLGGGVLGLGGGAGIGVETGLSAGLCGTVEAARAEGFVTDDEVSRLFEAAVAEISDLAPEDGAADGAMAMNPDDCAAVLARIRETAGD